MSATTRLEAGVRPTWRAVTWQGVLGSALVVLGSWGVGFLPSSPHSFLSRSALLVWFRVPDGSIIATACLLVLGGLVMVRSWLLLGRLAVRSDWAEPEPERVRHVRRAVWAWSAPLLLALPVFSQDVYSYAAQGRLMGQGGDPYTDWVSQLPGWFGEGSDVLWAQSSSPYGPLFLALAQAVYWVSGGVPEVNVLLFRLLGLAGTWLALVAVPRLCTARGVDAGWGSWIVVANPLWLLSMVASAHNDSLMVGLVLLGFAAALRGRVAVALLAVAAGIAVKPIVVLGLPFLGLALAGHDASWRRRIGYWALTALVVGAVLALLGAVTGLWFGWIGAMADQGSAALPLAPWGLVGWGLGGLVTLLHGPGAVVQGAVYTLGKVAAVGLTVWLALRRPALHPLAAFGLALAAAVVLSPTVQPWYVLWVLPLFVTWRAWYGAWEQLVIVLSAVTSLGGLVWLLSVPEWVPAPLVITIAGVLAALGLVWLGRVDPAGRPLLRGFRLSLLRRPATVSVLGRDPGVGTLRFPVRRPVRRPRELTDQKASS